MPRLGQILHLYANCGFITPVKHFNNCIPLYYEYCRLWESNKNTYAIYYGVLVNGKMNGARYNAVLENKKSVEAYKRFESGEGSLLKWTVVITITPELQWNDLNKNRFKIQFNQLRLKILPFDIFRFLCVKYSWKLCRIFLHLHKYLLLSLAVLYNIQIKCRYKLNFVFI